LCQCIFDIRSKMNLRKTLYSMSKPFVKIKKFNNIFLNKQFYVFSWFDELRQNVNLEHKIKSLKSFICFFIFDLRTSPNLVVEQFIRSFISNRIGVLTIKKHLKYSSILNRYLQIAQKDPKLFANSYLVNVIINFWCKFQVSTVIRF